MIVPAVPITPAPAPAATTLLVNALQAISLSS